jgi:hypothetical protein
MKDDAPERIGLIRGPFGGWRLWDNTSSHEEADARYIRADAPPTLAEAMRCEEVKALAEALTPFAFFDEEGGDTQKAWEIRYLDRFKDWIDFADIERARAALAKLKGPTP